MSDVPNVLHESVSEKPQGPRMTRERRTERQKSATVVPLVASDHPHVDASGTLESTAGKIKSPSPVSYGVDECVMVLGESLGTVPLRTTQEKPIPPLYPWGT